MADETSVLRSELASLRGKLARLKSELHCAICRGPLRTPVVLRCGHSFCSECARRALLSRSCCPEAHCTMLATTVDLCPVRALESCVAYLFPTPEAPVLGDKTKPTRERLVHLPTSSRTALVKELRKLGLRADGTTEVLAKRHREFVTLWNANLDAAVPLSEAAIVAQVMCAERALAAAASCKPGGIITNLFRKRPAPSPSENADERNEILPQEGDSFNTLVHKIRRREGRSLPVPRPQEPTPPQKSTPPREPTPQWVSSSGDLALIEAADRASQGNQAALTPPSPSSMNLALTEAVDRASQSEELQTVAEVREPQTPQTPRTNRRDDFWATDDDTRSTIAPSPVRPPPTSQSPRPASLTSAPAVNLAVSPPPARRPRQQATIHVRPWRPVQSKIAQFPMVAGTRSQGSVVDGSSDGTTPVNGFSTTPRPGQFQQLKQSQSLGPGLTQLRGPLPYSASPGQIYVRESSWRQTLSNKTQPSFSQSQGFSQGPVNGLSNGRPSLTEEQRARIERNRQQAIQRQLAARKRREDMLRGGPPP